MKPSEVFTNIVDKSAKVELLNQMNLVKNAHKQFVARDIAKAVIATKQGQNKAAAISIGGIVNALKGAGSTALSKIPTKAQAAAGAKGAWNWAKTNPGKASIIGGAATGVGTAGGVALANGVKQNKDTFANDPVVKALSNPLKMTKDQWINTGVGAGAALAGGAGVYALLSQIPGIRRKPLLKALMAMAGGATLGYAGWRASDNYQKA